MQYVNPLDHPNIVIEGLPFIREDRVYRRFLVKTDVPLPAGVEDLAWCTTGGQLRFAFRGTKLGVRVTLRKPAGQMYHMPATGEAGIDCYISYSGCEPEYLAIARNVPGEKDYEHTFFTFPEKRLLDVTLNLPLYNGIDSLELEMEDEDEILPPLRQRALMRTHGKYPGKNPGKNPEDPCEMRPGKIVVYGGSIDQGGCANRPGMVYSNILSRWLNVEFVNLGFSGSGKAEAEVAREIAKIDGVTGFVINTAGNCPDAQWLYAHMPTFLSILRERYPSVPMLIFQLAPWTCHLTDPEAWENFQQKWAIEERVVAERKAIGDKNISIYKMDYSCEFMGHSLTREVTVDGTHPTDLGLLLQAEKLYPILKEWF